MNASLPSLVSGFSESEGVCTGVRGLAENIESVSENELRLDGEEAWEVSVAFRFSAGNHTNKKK